jgi:hypothetical protein
LDILQSTSYSHEECEFGVEECDRPVDFNGGTGVAGSSLDNHDVPGLAVFRVELATFVESTAGMRSLMSAIQMAADRQTFKGQGGDKQDAVARP